MNTQTIRRERGFLDTRGVSDRPATRGPGPVRAFLRESAVTLRGAVEAPLRLALSPRGDRALRSLDASIRRDIGL